MTILVNLLSILIELKNITNVKVFDIISFLELQAVKRNLWSFY